MLKSFPSCSSRVEKFRFIMFAREKSVENVQRENSFRFMPREMKRKGLRKDGINTAASGRTLNYPVIHFLFSPPLYFLFPRF